MIGWILAGVILLAAFLGLVRSAYERKCLTTVEYEVPLSVLSSEFDGMRLVFLTDIHNKSFGVKNEKLLSVVDEISPDMVLVGGDVMVARGQADCSLDVTLEFVSALAKKYPVYYGYGNHELRLKTLTVYEERYPQFLEGLRQAGVRILDDCNVSFHGKNGSLTISGLTLTEETYHQLVKKPLEENYIEERLGSVPKNDVRILLAHNPLYFEEYARWGADLTLAGHYHGGTIILPILGGVMSPDYHLFPKRYRGKYVIGEQTMVLSGGLGTHSVNIRFGNKPEVSVITLKRK